MSGTNLGAYSTTAASNATVGSVNFAEGQAPSTVNDSARALMADLRTFANTLADGWVEYGDGDSTYTAAYVGASQFKFSGVDLTSKYHVGRRVRVVAATPGTIVGTITTSAFSTDTTLTISWDSGNLSNEAITSVHLGPAYTNTAIPGRDSFATIASASTVNIGAAAATYLQVTGTTTITAFDTVQAGIERTLEFAAALTLTHNGTSLILPGAASITTAAGDVARMRSEGSGNWRCVGYQRAGFVPPAIPLGTILSYGGTSAPTGWLLCFGQNVSRTTYAALFAIIGTNFGVGDGSTTFGIPDLRGRATFGKDDMGGSAASRVTNGTSGITGTTLGAAGGDERLHAHTHTENQLIGGSGVSGGATFTGATGNTGTAGAGSSQNMPPALIVNRIIFAGV